MRIAASRLIAVFSASATASARPLASSRASGATSARTNRHVSHASSAKTAVLRTKNHGVVSHQPMSGRGSCNHA